MSIKKKLQKKKKVCQLKSTYLKVKVGFYKVLVQSRRKVLSCGQDDAADRKHTQTVVNSPGLCYSVQCESDVCKLLDVCQSCLC